MEKDIRWEQRFSNFIKAMDKLRQSVEFIQAHTDSNELAYHETLGEMMKEGLIQRFGIYP